MWIYDPYSRRTASPAPFSFAIPSEEFTSKDLRAIKRSARKERARILRLPPGELTPVQRRYAESISRALAKVDEQRVTYARAVGEALIAAQHGATSAATDPPEPPVPASPAPMDGTARNLWLADVRRYAQYEAECDRLRVRAAKAEADIRHCELEIEALAHFAAVARASWSRFAQVLFQLHADFVVGANKVDLHLPEVPFSALEPPAPMQPLALQTRQEPPTPTDQAATNVQPTEDLDPTTDHEENEDDV